MRHLLFSSQAVINPALCRAHPPASGAGQECGESSTGPMVLWTLQAVPGFLPCCQLRSLWLGTWQPSCLGLLGPCGSPLQRS